MVKPNLDDEVKQLFEDIDKIKNILNQHNHGGYPPPGITWPNIILPIDEITKISAILENNGKIVADIRRISNKLPKNLSELAQNIIDSHSSCFKFSSDIENGLMHQSEHGKISNLIDWFYKTIVDFQTGYRTHRSYNQDNVFNNAKFGQKLSPKKVISVVLLILVAVIGGGAAIYHVTVIVNSPTSGDNSNTGNTQSGDGSVNVAGSGNSIVNTGPGTINVIQNPPS